MTEDQIEDRRQREASGLRRGRHTIDMSCVINKAVSYSRATGKTPYSQARHHRSGRRYESRECARGSERACRQQHRRTIHPIILERAIAYQFPVRRRSRTYEQIGASTKQRPVRPTSPSASGAESGIHGQAVETHDWGVVINGTRLARLTRADDKVLLTRRNKEITAMSDEAKKLIY